MKSCLIVALLAFFFSSGSESNLDSVWPWVHDDGKCHIVTSVTSEVVVAYVSEHPEATKAFEVNVGDRVLVLSENGEVHRAQVEWNHRIGWVESDQLSNGCAHREDWSEIAWVQFAENSARYFHFLRQTPKKHLVIRQDYLAGGFVISPSSRYVALDFGTDIFGSLTFTTLTTAPKYIRLATRAGN